MAALQWKKTTLFFGNWIKKKKTQEALNIDWKISEKHK